MNDFQFKLVGLEDFKRRMLDISDEKKAKGAARRALRKGAEAVKERVVNNAKSFDDPETREKIYENIDIRGGGARAERRVNGAMVRVGVLGGARFSTAGKDAPTSAPGGGTAHFRLLEFGTSKMKAQPFLRPAFSKSAVQVGDIVSDYMEDWLTREAKRLERQISKATGGK